MLFDAGLSGRDVADRVQFRIHHGDRKNGRSGRRIHAHGNFAESVPSIVSPVGFQKLDGASRTTIDASPLPLLVARFMRRPIGMTVRSAPVRQFACRGTAAASILAVLTAAAVLLLIRIG